MKLSALQKQLLNDFQQDFPLTPRPYQQIARQLSVSEQDVLDAVQVLQDSHLIQRIGSVIQPNTIGSSVLAAMAVPESELDSVAGCISQFSEVNHNYERDNRLNLWFVLVAEDKARLKAVIKTIEQQTGYTVLSFPMLKDFFINLGFELDLSNG